MAGTPREKTEGENDGREVDSGISGSGRAGGVGKGYSNRGERSKGVPTMEEGE